jgi:3-phenylpropionate/trans-cinnamate dioxygenase ferredoxin subunit
MARQLRWIKLSELEILPDDDFVKSVQVNKKRICLIKTEDRWFATQAKCPHAGADLSQGWCKNGKLICPFHRYEYDLQSGNGSPGQDDYIDTYPLQIRQDGIYIGWKESWFKQLIKRIWRPKFSK